MADLRNVFRRTPPSALMHAAMMLLTGLLPCMALGIPGAIAVFVFGWPLAAMMHAAVGLPAVALLPGGAAGMALLLPAELFWVPLAWAVLGGIGILVPESTLDRRAIRWGALAAAAVCAVFGALALRYTGETAAGLAQELTNWLDASPQRDSVLLSAYQAGLASADASLLPRTPLLPSAVPDGYTATPNALYTVLGKSLSDEAAHELLNSLRTSLEMLFRVYAPQLTVTFIGLTTVLCMVVPDEWLRRRGRNDQPLPQMEEWKLSPRTAAVAAFGLMLGIAPYLSGSTTMSYMLTMCSGAAMWAYMVQGAGYLARLLKRRGTHRSTRYTIALVLAVLLPRVLEILGIIDQITSLRKRGDTES